MLVKPKTPTVGNPVGVVICGVPFEEDTVSGEPLSSSLGRTFIDELVAAGLNPNKLLFIPVVDKPFEKKYTTDELLKAAHDSGFEKYLPKEPTPTLVVGSAAWKVYDSGGAVDRGRGFIRHHPTRHERYLVTWTPYEAFAKNPARWGHVQADLQRFQRLVSGSLLGSIRPAVVDCTDNPQAIEHFRKSLTGKAVAVDIETGPEKDDMPWTGKDPTRAKLRSIAFGIDDYSIAIHIEKCSTPVWDEVVKFLNDTSIRRVYHNGWWFDLRVLARYTRSPDLTKNIFDTRDARRAVSVTSELSLRNLVSLYTDYEPWKEKESSDGEKVVFTRNIADLLQYNGLDTSGTARVYSKLHLEANENARVSKLYDVHTRTSKLAAKMHDRGILIDPDRQRALSEDLSTIHKERKKELRDLVGLPNYEPTDTNVRAVIFKRHAKSGIPCFDMPDPRDPNRFTNDELSTISVDKDSLVQLLIDPSAPEGLKKFIETYWHCQAPAKIKSTFVDSELIRQAVGKDGRVRPGWNSCGTETMRWSCSQPNVQNIPDAKDEDSMSGKLPSARSMYVAAPGYVFVNADYSQQELRVMQAVSGDSALKTALDTGDVYTYDAWNLYGLPHGTPVKKEARKGCKCTHLAFQYAAGTNKVYEMVLKQKRDMDFLQVQALHRGLKKLYKGTVDYWHSEFKRVLDCGYSEGRLLFGRIQYPKEPPITETSNFPIQRTAGELTNLALIAIASRLEKEKLDGTIIAQVHDSILLEVKEEQAEKAAAILKEEMERPVVIEGAERVFPTDIKIGKRWSDV